MPVQLYVLGPAFGLPSIDAECNAAVALLNSRLSADYDALLWELIPTHELNTPVPCLVDNDRRISGFSNIARHVSQLSGPKCTGEPDSDTSNADAIALSAYISSHAPILLEILLYVSFENYRHTTRPAYTKILPWHTNYIIPPRRRSQARARTEHLGIASIDVDNVHEDISNRPPGFDVGKDPRAQGFEAEAKSRASLLLPRKETVRSLLRRPEHAATFKLHTLADNFFGQLEDMLGNKTFFSDTPEANAIDCLAYGYLSLMLYPQVPQDWLASTMRKKYKRLVKYTETMHERLRLQTDVDKVLSMSSCKTQDDIIGRRKANGMALPWCPPATLTILNTVSGITHELLTHVPLLGLSSTQIIPVKATKPSFWQHYLPLLLGSTILSLAGFGYYAFTTSLLVWSHGEQVQIFGRKRFSDYGHLGAAISGISLLGAQARRDQAFREQEVELGPVKAEVDVEGDRPLR